MGRIKAEAKKRSGEFLDLITESKENGEHNDCAVKAVTIVTGLPYAKVLEAFKARGRRNRSGVYNGMIKSVLKDLGFTYSQFALDVMIENYPKPGQLLKSVTTHHPVRYKGVWDRMVGDDSLLLFTYGHVAAYKGREVHDHTRGRPCRVFMALKVWKEEV